MIAAALALTVLVGILAPALLPTGLAVAAVVMTAAAATVTITSVSVDKRKRR